MTDNEKPVEPVTVELKDGRNWVVLGRVIYGADAEVGVWINERLGGGSIQSLFIALGILKPGVDPKSLTPDTLPDALAGGAYFYDEHNDADYSNIWCSVAVDENSAGAPDVVAQILDYPFRERQLQRITAMIVASNERAVRQAQKLGFELQGTLPNFCKGGGAVHIFGLEPSSCPFWKAAA